MTGCFLKEQDTESGLNALFLVCVTGKKTLLHSRITQISTQSLYWHTHTHRHTLSVWAHSPHLRLSSWLFALQATGDLQSSMLSPLAHLLVCCGVFFPEVVIGCLNVSWQLLTRPVASLFILSAPSECSSAARWLCPHVKPSRDI